MREWSPPRGLMVMAGAVCLVACGPTVAKAPTAQTEVPSLTHASHAPVVAASRTPTPKGTSTTTPQPVGEGSATPDASAAATTAPASSATGPAKPTPIPTATPTPIVGATPPPVTQGDVIYRAPYTVSLVAGGGLMGDGVGADATIGNSSGYPIGMAVDGNSLLFSDARFFQIRKVDLVSDTVSLLVGAPDGRSAGPDPDINYLELPSGLGLDTKRKVCYFADGGHNRLCRLARSGNTVGMAVDAVDVIAGKAGYTGPSLVNVGGILVDGDSLYYACPSAKLLGKIDLSSAAFTATALASGQGATSIPNRLDLSLDRTHTQFGSPSGLAMSLDHHTLYVADSTNSVIWAVDLTSDTGKITIFAGTLNPGDVDGPHDKATLQSPIALAIDKDNLYVGENLNFRVRAISLADRSISTVAGGTTAGLAVGARDKASFTAITGLAIDRQADNSLKALYVYDGGDRVANVAGRILKITP